MLRPPRQPLHCDPPGFLNGAGRLLFVGVEDLVPSLLQWVSSTAAKPRKYRIYVIFGEDAVLRADALDRALRLADPQERRFLRVGYSEGEVSAATVWDAVQTQPMPGISRRVVVVHEADRMRSWKPLKDFIGGASVYPETTLILMLNRTTIGKRVRNKQKSLPGAPVYETSYEEWEEWLRDYSSAALLSCAPLSADQADRAKPSAVARWLSLRVPVSQQQAEYLWRRVGESSLLARDVIRSFRLAGVQDASALGQAQFVSYVDAFIGRHGASDLVDHLLFERKAEAFATVLAAEFSRAEWSKILGLLGQRLDWLGELHGALRTNEKLDQVMSRLQIPRHMILYYAHRDDASHNVARLYDPARVARSRRLLADLDSTLSGGISVPTGFGECLVASW